MRKVKAKRGKPTTLSLCPDCDALLGRGLSDALSQLRHWMHRRHFHPNLPLPPYHGPGHRPDFEKCPECGTELRADHLPRHLRHVHKMGDATGKIPVNKLASILRINNSSIIAYLAQLRDPRVSHSQALDDALVGKVLQHIFHTPNRSEKMIGPTERVHAREDPDILRAMVVGLKSKIFKPNVFPKESPVGLIGVPTERLSFKLLPPGTWDMEDVMAYYQREAHRFPADIRDREIEWSRLETIGKALRPSKCYRGEDQWDGYHAFEIPGTSRVVIVCPGKGNATYVLWGDWQRMVAHTKSYIWRNFPQNYRKIIHGGKRKWLWRVKRALKL